MIIDLIATIVHTSVLLTYGVQVVQPVPPSELHVVSKFEGRPVAPFFSDARKCRYYGLAVPYERDWEIVSENTMTHTTTVLPPEPGKIESYAVLVNKKTCPGQEPEHLLIGGTKWTGSNLLHTNYGIIKDVAFTMTSISKDPNEQPKWLAQVMKVLEEAEATNPEVKEFLDYSRAGVSEAQSTPKATVKSEAAAAESTETSTAQ